MNFKWILFTIVMLLFLVGLTYLVLQSEANARLESKLKSDTEEGVSLSHNVKTLESEYDSGYDSDE